MPSSPFVMEADTQILDVVFRALDDVNRTLPPDQQVPKAEDAPLAEPAGPLTSLGLVNLVVALEDRVEQTFGASVNLADAASDMTEENPFATVRSLARHVQAQLRGAGGT